MSGPPGAPPAPEATEELDRRVRLHLYREFVERGAPPSVAATAAVVGVGREDAARAYRRLADGHVIVLRPGTLDVWMANPLSAEPTGFRVTVGERWWWGSCAWDALGIPAMLHADGEVATTCADCGEPMALRVRAGSLEVDGEGLAHFAVPAARWWEDIGDT